MAHQVKITKQRFFVPGYSPQKMVAIGQQLTNSVRDRISEGMTVYDAPAPPLAPKYAKAKGRKAPPAIRNWKLTGRTMRSLAVLSAAHNKAVIGFTDPVSNMRAAINNARTRQFGVSPKNNRDLGAALAGAGSPVTVEGAYFEMHQGGRRWPTG